MRDDDELGNPQSPGPGNNGVFPIEQLKQILTRMVRMVRWERGLDCRERDVQADVNWALEFVLTELELFTDVEKLEEWLLSWARRAVDESIVARTKRTANSLEGEYCDTVLGEGVTHNFTHYCLSSSRVPLNGTETLKDQLLKSKLLKSAKLEMRARLADYTGKVPLHRWIKQVAHRVGVERGNIHSLNDWLHLIARLEVERYVVMEMQRNPNSPLARLNMIWVARHVAPYFKTRCGEPESPWMSEKDLWAVLMDPEKKPDLHEKICHCTDQVVKRILSGLPNFRGESTLDTWRTTILRHVMFDELAAMTPSPDQPTTLTFSQLEHNKDGRDVEEFELALADDGTSLLDRTIHREACAVLKEIIEQVKAEMPETAEVIDLTLAGYKPREIAQILDIPAAKVSGLKHKFIKRAIVVWIERGGPDLL